MLRHSSDLSPMQPGHFDANENCIRQHYQSKEEVKCGMRDNGGQDRDSRAQRFCACHARDFLVPYWDSRTPSRIEVFRLQLHEDCKPFNSVPE